MIRLACPGCGAAFNVADENAGKTGKCPKCDAQFLIPAPAEVPPPLPTPTQDSVEARPCPGCQARVAVERVNIGTTVECPTCATRFLAEPVETVPPPPQDTGDFKTSKRSWGDDDRERERDDAGRGDAGESRRRPSRRERLDRKPQEIAIVGGTLLGGGVYSFVHAGGMGALSMGFCCCWPGVWLVLVWSIFAIVRGAAMLGAEDRGLAPKTLVVLQILAVLNGDFVNMTLGIVGWVLLNRPEVQNYYHQNRRE